MDALVLRWYANVLKSLMHALSVESSSISISTNLSFSVNAKCLAFVGFTLKS